MATRNLTANFNIIREECQNNPKSLNEEILERLIASDILSSSDMNINQLQEEKEHSINLIESVDIIFGTLKIMIKDYIEKKIISQRTVKFIDEDNSTENLEELNCQIVAKISECHSILNSIDIKYKSIRDTVLQKRKFLFNMIKYYRKHTNEFKKYNNQLKENISLITINPMLEHIYTKDDDIESQINKIDQEDIKRHKNEKEIGMIFNQLSSIIKQHKLKILQEYKVEVPITNVITIPDNRKLIITRVNNQRQKINNSTTCTILFIIACIFLVICLSTILNS